MFYYPVKAFRQVSYTLYVDSIPAPPPAALAGWPSPAEAPRGSKSLGVEKCVTECDCYTVGITAVLGGSSSRLLIFRLQRLTDLSLGA